MKQYKYYFSFHQIQIYFTLRANFQIIQITHQKKIGARGLKNMIEEILTPVMYLIPSIDKQNESQQTTLDNEYELHHHHQYQQQQYQHPQISPHRHPLYHTILVDEKVIQIVFY